jgi:NADPH:quinone reductase-like Zn-dependent oxidoreductase
MNQTMTAVVAQDYGPPENLTVARIPVPRPGPGQIQVRVRAVSLNPGELRMLGGAVRDQAPLSFPYVPGGDFAGTVTEIGDGAGRFDVGDEVFGLALDRSLAALAAQVASPPSLTTGALAEYAVFEADTPGLALRPAGLDADHAATLPTVGLTALPLLRTGEFRPGAVVLVVGATGGVGSVLLPLLADARVHILATATPADESYVRDLGANEVVDHSATDIVKETLVRFPDGVDAVLNLARRGDELHELAPAIRPGGGLLNIAFPAPDPAEFGDLVVDTILSTARPGDLDFLAARAIEGVLPSAISGRYRLEDAPQAWSDLRNKHTRGKLVVTTGRK